MFNVGSFEYLEWLNSPRTVGIFCIITYVHMSQRGYTDVHLTPVANSNNVLTTFFQIDWLFQ